METEALDALLELQLTVAWAGEAKSDPPRLGWWQTGMVDEFGGEDLLRRLTPKTWQWAVLEATRAAAIKVDDAARSEAEDADHLQSLFRLGADMDERLAQRLLELKQSGRSLESVFPALAGRLQDWSKEAFTEWLASLGVPGYASTPTGRKLTGDLPSAPETLGPRLAAALQPLPDHYPLPHVRTRR